MYIPPWFLIFQDAASPRYIFTALQKAARAVFHPDDDQLLTYLDDDGLSIEPEYYMPVIPLILVNGSDGIGTGWSSQVCTVLYSTVCREKGGART